MNDLVVARTSGVVMHEGRRLHVQAGRTIARAGHPIVTEHPALWEPVSVHYDLPGAADASAAADVPSEKGAKKQGKKAAGAPEEA